MAIPTETVYGLAACMFDEAAVQKIFTVKQRPGSNPLIVHVPDFKSLEPLVSSVPPVAMELAAACWPGPLTMIFSKSMLVPDIITGGQQTVAIRIPSHPLTLELLQELDFPLAAPSANKFNYISPVSAIAVDEMLGKEIPYILDGGDCEKGIESTIVAFKNNQVQLLRKGAITEEELTRITSVELVSADHDIRHPGMHQKHYSPRTPVLLTNNIRETISLLHPLRVALLSFCNPYDGYPVDRKLVLSPDGHLEEAARTLYSSLYQLDKEGYDVIVAEEFPDKGLGRAINDRLNRASIPF